MPLKTIALADLLTPCCERSTSFDVLLDAAEWAANSRQWPVGQWNYYHCPDCGTPVWFGSGEDAGFLGIFGAAPVADLIAVLEVPDLPRGELRAGGVAFHWEGREVAIPGDRRYWTA